MIPASKDVMLPQRYRVEKMRRETGDTFTLELEAVDGVRESSYAPGQFNMLYVYGFGEVPISISGDPELTNKLVHTTRAVGNVTAAMSQLKRGHEIGIRGPFGTEWPVKEAEGQDVVIVAGGIGLAPLRPALHHLISNREKYGKIVLLYGTRTPSDILYEKNLKAWRAQFDLDIYVTVDRAMSGWRGNVGVVTKLILRAPFDPLSTLAMVCGPEIMMRFSVAELQKRGVKADRIYVSMERNMKCGIGHCGHCQFGPKFVCKDGPVFCYDEIERLFVKREL